MGEIISFPTSNMDKRPYDMTPPKAPKDGVEVSAYVMNVNSLAHSVEWNQNSNQEDGGPMDDGYKRLLDRLDQDMRDHKQEIRDRDARILADAQEREQRYREESREHEQRILNAIERMETNTREAVQRIETRMDKLEQKIDEGTRHIQTMSMSVVIGVAAMVVAVMVGILWPTFFPPHSSTPAATTNSTTK